MRDKLRLTTVEGWHYDRKDTYLSAQWAVQLVLQQRTFGPRRLLVVTAREDREVIGVAHCDRTDPPDLGLKCCLAALNHGAAAAVAYSDEPVALESPPDLLDRFVAARAVAAEFEVHLLDWFMCDDLHFKSIRNAVGPPAKWWDLPADRRSRR